MMYKICVVNKQRRKGRKERLNPLRLGGGQGAFINPWGFCSDSYKVGDMSPQAGKTGLGRIVSNQHRRVEMTRKQKELLMALSREVAQNTKTHESHVICKRVFKEN